MAWIESHQELARHPKTKKFARTLDLSLPAAVGHLHFLWWWALDYAKDGDLSRFDDADIADACAWEGEPSKFVKALREAGFIEDTLIHDWYEYAGRLIEKRAANVERAKKSRERNANVARNVNERYGATEPDLTIPKVHSPAEPDDAPPFGEIVDHLNGVCGTKYKPSGQKTQAVIRARWNDGFRLDDFLRVIDVKQREWSGTDHEKYLRPETLFGQKFEGYLNQKLKQQANMVLNLYNPGEDDDREEPMPGWGT